MRRAVVCRNASATAQRPHIRDCAVAREIAGFLAEGKARTVALTGAGVSTPSGIPDYRSPGGMYSRPEFTPLHWTDFRSSDAYQRRYWARSMFGYPAVRRAESSGAHLALAGLQARGFLRSILTQNVDGLHHLAANQRLATVNPAQGGATEITDAESPIDDEPAADWKRRSPLPIFELHGNIHEVACIGCAACISRRYYQTLLVAANAQALKAYTPTGDAVRPDGDLAVPDALTKDFTLVKCPKCSEAMRPNVVMFGGSVPKPLVDQCFDECREATHLLCVGTSLQVYSAYRFAEFAAKAGKRVAIVNNGPSRADALVSNPATPHVRRFDVEDVAAVLPIVAALLP